MRVNLIVLWTCNNRTDHVLFWRRPEWLAWLRVAPSLGVENPTAVTVICHPLNPLNQSMHRLLRDLGFNFPYSSCGTTGQAWSDERLPHQSAEESSAAPTVSTV